MARNEAKQHRKVLPDRTRQGERIGPEPISKGLLHGPVEDPEERRPSDAELAKHRPTKARVRELREEE